MNKRKPDDEFARIDLSYTDANGKEIVVHCPESRNATVGSGPWNYGEMKGYTWSVWGAL